MKHLLLIEPNAQLGATYQRSLELTGDWQVSLCSHAQAAITAADAQQPDVVVLELELARHNGFEFLYEFRSYPEWRQVPVVVHSFVRPDPDVMHKGSWTDQMGITSYLYKPLTSLAKLNEMAQKALIVAST